jgi:hypothetical protein
MIKIDIKIKDYQHLDRDNKNHACTRSEIVKDVRLSCPTFIYAIGGFTRSLSP